MSEPTKTVSEPVTEGWVSLANSPKVHYVRGEKSLCRKWLYLGSLFDGDDGKLGGAPNRDDCAPCWRARKKELTLGAEQTP